MEAIKSIYFEIQERFRNPIISTFVISWLFWNWKISLLTIHFLTHSKSTVTIDIYVLKVQAYASVSHSIIYPIATVFFYILIFPFIRNGVSYIQTWFERKKTELELKASNGSSVSIEKYMVLRNDYMTKIKELENVIAGESVQIKRNEELNEKNKQLEIDFRSKIDEHDMLKKQLNSALINGMWSFKIINNENLNQIFDKIDRVHFKNNKFSCYYKEDTKAIIQGNINLFHADFNEQLVFILLEIKDVLQESNFPVKPMFLFFELKELENLECLTGKLNFVNTIEMFKNRPIAN